MFGRINEQMKIFACVFEIEQNKQIHKQTIEAPRIMLEQQFMSLVKQAANNTTPIKIKMSRKVPVWNQFENRWIDIENSVTFTNIAYGEL